MTLPKRTINPSAHQILAGCTTDGAGGLATPTLQQNTAGDAAGDTSAWAIVDGPAGRIQLTLGAPVAGQRIYATVSAFNGTTTFLARASPVDPLILEVVVSAETQTVVDLDTTVVAIRLIAYTL